MRHFELQAQWAQRDARELRAIGCFDSANQCAENAKQLLDSGRYLQWRGLELSEREQIALSRRNCVRWDELTAAGAKLDWPRPFGPSRDGSTRCRSGSIASGGTNTYCSCDTCF